MSCLDCENAQDSYNGNVYVRVGNGNVEVIGCEKHTKELIEKLRKASSDG
jgi:hypothetical protein